VKGHVISHLTYMQQALQLPYRANTFDNAGVRSGGLGLGRRHQQRYKPAPWLVLVVQLGPQMKVWAPKNLRTKDQQDVTSDLVTEGCIRCCEKLSLAGN
jgi:hypothetical protein